MAPTDYGDSGTEFIIRPFRREDQSAVRELILDGLGDHFEQLDESANPDVDDITDSYLSCGHLFVVAEMDGECVGSGGLVAEGDGVGRIVRMSVKRHCRRRAVARAIVEHLLRSTARRRYASVVVETNHDWPDAIGLYKSCGFTEYDRDEECVHFCLQLEPDVSEDGK